MQKTKFLAAILVSAMMASALAMPSSATASSFTPTGSNFLPLFDFDSVPTAQYTDGYQPGGSSDVIGNSNSEKCIDATNVNTSYTLTISKGAGYKGNALVDTVTDQAPASGSFDPIALNCGYGENNLPGCADGETPTDFVFWVDMTGYKADSNQPKLILPSITELDYDSAGNALNTCTVWWPKAPEEGGYYQLEDDNGGWVNGPMPDVSDHYLSLPSGYKGWVKIPLSSFEVVDYSGNQDADGKFDGKQILSIELAMGDYQYQQGSVVVFDEFGLIVDNTSASTTASTTESTTAATTTTATTTASTAATSSSTANSTTTTAAQSTATTATTTVSAQPATTATAVSDTTGTTVSNPKTGGSAKAVGLFSMAIVAAGIAAAACNKKKVK